MSMFIDRSGIFKARVTGWAVQPSPSSKAVAIQVDFIILAQLGDGGVWASWEECEEHTARGYWYIVGKDGKVNQTAIEQLVRSMGWEGDLRAVEQQAPVVTVQITVSEETYNGKTRFKVSWMNPENYVPTGGGASSDTVSKLAVQFGSLLRAAASVAKTAPKPALPPVKKDDIPL